MIDIVVLGLSSAIVALLITREDIFATPRGKIISYFAKTERLHLIADLVDCPYCMSWWVAPGLMFGLFQEPSALLYLPSVAVAYLAIKWID